MNEQFVNVSKCQKIDSTNNQLLHQHGFLNNTHPPYSNGNSLLALFWVRRQWLEED